MKVEMKILKTWAKGKESPQLELAFKAKVSTGTVSNLFNGLAPKREKTREKIALVLNVDECELFPESREDLAS